jgi:predicted anti-sigma-YlaC factor YlaD
MGTSRETPRSHARLLAVLGTTGVLLTSGCSLNRYAVNKLGDALAGSGSTFASDDDPELVGQATPFSLKLIESLLASAPEHRGLLLAAASGFTQYSYAFVQQQADSFADLDPTRAEALRARARHLYLRARSYGLRGLETRHARFGERLRADPRAAVGAVTAGDVPLLYWTASAWGAAIAISKDVPDLIADQPIVEALIDRALELDEGFGGGAIHTFLISYELSRRGAAGDPAERARAHFQRAVSLSRGRLASPYVSLAEGVSVSQQDRREFESLLRQALAIDPDASPEFRLVNIIVQRRARWLLTCADQLFLDPAPGSSSRGPPSAPAGSGATATRQP